MVEGEENLEGMETSPGLSPGPEPADVPDLDESFLHRWHFEIRIFVSYVVMNIGMLVVGVILVASILLLSYMDDMLGPGSHIFATDIMTMVVYPLRHDSLFTLSFVLSGFLLVLIACYFIAGRDIKKALFENLGLRVNRNSIKQFAAGAAIGTTLIISCILISYFMGYSNYDIKSISWLFSESLILTFFSMTTLLAICELLAGSIGEEVFFRGYLQRMIAGKYGILPGIFMASILFSITHGFGLSGLPMDYLGYLCFGVAMGCIYYWSGSLFTTIGFHFAWNLLEELSGYVSAPLAHDIGSRYIELAGLRIGSWTTVIEIVLLGLLLLFYFKYKIQKETIEAEKRNVPAPATVIVEKLSVAPGTIFFSLVALVALIPALIFLVTAGLTVAYDIAPATPITTDLFFVAIVLVLLAAVFIGIRKQLSVDKDENKEAVVDEPQITGENQAIGEEIRIDPANADEIIVAEPESPDSFGLTRWVAIIIIVLLVLAISALTMGYI